MRIPCDGGPLDGQIVDVTLTDGHPPPTLAAMRLTPFAFATYADPNPDLVIREPRQHQYTLQKWKCNVDGHRPQTGCIHLEHHLRYV